MPSETNGQTAHHPPSADVYLTQHAVLVELEIPGFAADDLVVAASGHVVVVSGCRSPREQDRCYLLRERGPAEFRREFHLPAALDAENVTVVVADGVMTVRAPRLAAERSQPVEVTPALYLVNANCAVD